VNLLSQTGVDEPKLMRSEVIDHSAAVMEGKWDVILSPGIGQKSGIQESISIKNMVVYDFEGKKTGHVKHYDFETQTFIMKFEISGQGSIASYSLIHISRDEFSGFKDSKLYCYFRRRHV
jgi:hypothetical protein